MNPISTITPERKLKLLHQASEAIDNSDQATARKLVQEAGITVNLPTGISLDRFIAAQIKSLYNPTESRTGGNPKVDLGRSLEAIQSTGVMRYKDVMLPSNFDFNPSFSKVLLDRLNPHMGAGLSYEQALVREDGLTIRSNYQYKNRNGKKVAGNVSRATALLGSLKPPIVLEIYMAKALLASKAKSLGSAINNFNVTLSGYNALTGDTIFKFNIPYLANLDSTNCSFFDNSDTFYSFHPNNFARLLIDKTDQLGYSSIDPRVLPKSDCGLFLDFHFDEHANILLDTVGLHHLPGDKNFVSALQALDLEGDLKRLYTSGDLLRILQGVYDGVGFSSQESSGYLRLLPMSVHSRANPFCGRSTS